MGTQEQKEVRRQQIERLKLDLLGPTAADEVLRQNKETREGDTPTSRYLVGILYPPSARVEEQEDDFANEGGDAEEDDSSQAPIQITGIPKPSSIGLTFRRRGWLQRPGLRVPVRPLPSGGNSRRTSRFEAHHSLEANPGCRDGHHKC